MNDFSIILFYSATSSIWTARLLKKAGIERKMVPVPRNLSPDCGYCVRIKSDDIPRVREVLESGGVEFSRIEAWK
ncbi:MAG TPA: DUF3343 domain-containing protein [Spirochaetota bacterium]|nr:DUF3343 domain-containing protein [Spirochaetota bacterium]